MNYREAENYIFSRRRMGMRFDLERVDNLMRRVGEPQKVFDTIHVVGTNGKGSTTWMLSVLLKELGFKVGRMISPHLLDYRERIAVEGRWIPGEAVVEFVERFRDDIEETGATFFEITTVMAAWYFRKAGVDVVAAEAGLGGRLDATKLFRGKITVFTGVELEHSRILGSTEAVIAGEKVAVARPGSTLVAHVQSPDVERSIGEVIMRHGLERLIPPPSVPSPLPGAGQEANAALAAFTAGLYAGVPIRKTMRLLREPGPSMKWAGRIDLRAGTPPILFDVAHNPGSMEQLVRYVRKRWNTPLPAVIGFLADKQWKEMVRVLRGTFQPVVATTPTDERKLEAEVLREELSGNGIEACAVDDVGGALGEARKTGRGPVVVAGSFFVTGAAMLQAWRQGWIELPGAGDEAGQVFVDGGDVDTPRSGGI